MNEIEKSKVLSPGALLVRAIAMTLGVSTDYLLGLGDEVETDLLTAVAS